MRSPKKQQQQQQQQQRQAVCDGMRRKGRVDSGRLCWSVKCQIALGCRAFTLLLVVYTSKYINSGPHFRFLGLCFAIDTRRMHTIAR